MGQMQHKQAASLKADNEVFSLEYGALNSHRFDAQEIGDMLIADDRQTLQALGIGSTGQLLSVSSGKPAWSSSLAAEINVNDNVVFGIGTDKDGVLTLTSAGLSADAELTGVIVGTSNHQGIAADSLILSNITEDSDILMLVRDGSDSKEFLLANGDTADLQLGHGMATVTIKTASGDLTLSPGGDIDASSNAIKSIGASGNDLGANLWELKNANDAADNYVRVDNTHDSTGSDATFQCAVHASGGDPSIRFTITGEQSLSNGMDNSDSNYIVWSGSANIGSNNRMKLHPDTGVLSVDGDGGGSDDPVLLFDDDDDAMLLREITHTLADIDDKSAEERVAFRDLLVQKGIGSWAPQDEGPDRILLSVQGMWALHSGGIYQNRDYIDRVVEDMDALRQEMLALKSGQGAPNG